MAEAYGQISPVDLLSLIPIVLKLRELQLPAVFNR